MAVKTAIREQLAKRAPRLDETLVRARWRQRNRDRLLGRNAAIDPSLERIAETLRRDGIVVCAFEELFGSRELFDQVAAETERVLRDAQTAGLEPANPNKPFRLKPHTDAAYSFDEPFIRVALHPNVLAVANRYLGMRSLLRDLDIWLNVPTPDPAIETQLWHRDGDDVMNVKMFIYIREVEIPNGPFCYAPGTHPIGETREQPGRDANGRTHDEQMDAVQPKSKWLIGTGGAGTVILADTCGFHKQLKPTTGERLVVMSQYTSGTPAYPVDVQVDGIDPDTLTEDQRFAVAGAAGIPVGSSSRS